MTAIPPRQAVPYDPLPFLRPSARDFGSLLAVLSERERIVACSELARLVADLQLTTGKTSSLYPSKSVERREIRRIAGEIVAIVELAPIPAWLWSQFAAEVQAYLELIEADAAAVLVRWKAGQGIPAPNGKVPDGAPSPPVGLDEDEEARIRLGSDGGPLCD